MKFDFRVFVILVTLGLCGYGLYPTIQWAQMTPEQAAADPAKTEELRSRSINLGLDLQGGIHLVLGIKADKLKQNILLTVNRRIPAAFKEAGISVTSNKIVGDGIEFEVTPAARAERADEIERVIERLDFLDAPRFEADAANPQRVLVRASLNNERLAREVKEATGRALEIIRNRIDAFGVAEPSIQQVGDRKIVVELPGAADPDRARRLIGRTAQLEFHRVRDDAELNNVLTAIDAASGGELFKIITVQSLGDGLYDIHMKAEDKERVTEILQAPASLEAIPAASRIYLGSVSERKGEELIPLYMLEAEPAMTGEDLVMARVAYDERNKPSVSFEFGTVGAEEFGELTAELMRGQKRLAILLDEVVQSAPSVKSQIKSRGEITGNFTHEEARDLAVVLRSGALPAPVEILEDRTVGPSLGRDSIARGGLAASVAFVLVVLFMLVWYKGSGFIAAACLTFNLFVMMAVLAAINATLTLPGIAGIVLTIGMAVDANILIFERIKEEVRAGKGAFSAVNAGFEKALSAIIDSNITTLITAGALYEYGTGPIRGFAVTLSIGIITSVFSAVFVSRTVFDKFILSSRTPRISI
jgi:preprotein translocase subunit SecD